MSKLKLVENAKLKVRVQNAQGAPTGPRVTAYENVHDRMVWMVGRKIEFVDVGTGEKGFIAFTFDCGREATFTGRITGADPNPNGARGGVVTGVKTKNGRTVFETSECLLTITHSDGLVDASPAPLPPRRKDKS